jgi:hypothetical protein
VEMLRRRRGVHGTMSSPADGLRLGLVSAAEGKWRRLHRKSTRHEELPARQAEQHSRAAIAVVDVCCCDGSRASNCQRHLGLHHGTRRAANQRLLISRRRMLGGAPARGRPNSSCRGSAFRQTQEAVPLRGSCGLGPGSLLAHSPAWDRGAVPQARLRVNVERTRLGSRHPCSGSNPPHRPSHLLRHLQSLPSRLAARQATHCCSPAFLLRAHGFSACPAPTHAMSFSSLVSDIAYRKDADRGDEKVDPRSQLSRARSYASTTATSVSITGDIKSQLHGGYSHPLARSWQAERQLTKVGAPQRPRCRSCGS